MLGPPDPGGLCLLYSWDLSLDDQLLRFPHSPSPTGLQVHLASSPFDPLAY